MLEFSIFWSDNLSFTLNLDQPCLSTKPHLPDDTFTLQWKQRTQKCCHLVVTVRPQLNSRWDSASLGSVMETTHWPALETESRTRHSFPHRFRLCSPCWDCAPCLSKLPPDQLTSTPSLTGTDFYRVSPYSWIDSTYHLSVLQFLSLIYSSWWMSYHNVTLPAYIEKYLPEWKSEISHPQF